LRQKSYFENIFLKWRKLFGLKRDRGIPMKTRNRTVVFFLAEERATPWRNHALQPEVGEAAGEREASIRILWWETRDTTNANGSLKIKKPCPDKITNTMWPATKPTQEAAVKNYWDVRNVFSRPEKLFSHKSRRKVRLRKSNVWHQIFQLYVRYFYVRFISYLLFASFIYWYVFQSVPFFSELNLLSLIIF